MDSKVFANRWSCSSPHQTKRHIPKKARPNPLAQSTSPAQSQYPQPKLLWWHVGEYGSGPFLPRSIRKSLFFTDQLPYWLDVAVRLERKPLEERRGGFRISEDHTDHAQSRRRQRRNAVADGQANSKASPNNLLVIHTETAFDTPIHLTGSTTVQSSGPSFDFSRSPSTTSSPDLPLITLRFWLLDLGQHQCEDLCYALLRVIEEMVTTSRIHCTHALRKRHKAVKRELETKVQSQPVEELST
ncbi:hypothetical protein BJ875DRAFT_445524 [Amylocarpus encephaloides]|uniref:Uncharacterized protein n=1 Tax=Amylocarpus encephaloides TaxID=45428 RepID=A0A9P7YAL7_9HELO|nr:hypothetical protein BJ875DRAFT_445524 [Amylocarpus encephaloides]